MLQSLLCNDVLFLVPLDWCHQNFPNLKKIRVTQTQPWVTWMLQRMSCRSTAVMIMQTIYNSMIKCTCYRSCRNKSIQCNRSDGRLTYQQENVSLSKVMLLLQICAHGLDLKCKHKQKQQKYGFSGQREQHIFKQHQIPATPSLLRALEDRENHHQTLATSSQATLVCRKSIILSDTTRIKEWTRANQRQDMKGKWTYLRGINFLLNHFSELCLHDSLVASSLVVALHTAKEERWKLKNSLLVPRDNTKNRLNNKHKRSSQCFQNAIQRDHTTVRHTPEQKRCQRNQDEYARLPAGQVLTYISTRPLSPASRKWASKFSCVRRWAGITSCSAKHESNIASWLVQLYLEIDKQQAAMHKYISKDRFAMTRIASTRNHVGPG